MIFQILLQLSSLIAVSVSSPLYYPNCNNTNVNATVLNTLNGKVQGACFTITVNYSSYKPNLSQNLLTWLGVPYAQPPIGNLRFKNPVPVQTWANTRDGTNYSSSCLQPGRELDVTSEDCLYLNIFVPYNVYLRAVIQNDSTSQAPIYVWIHGGANLIGSASDVDPSTMVAISDIIIVTINYRLGLFGFLTVLNTDAKGNQGFLDQSLAFKWVFDNANLFGGDKTRITIGGQSAGAWNVGFHLLYKPSWPYFSRAIMQSGSPSDLSSNLATPEVAHIFAAVAGSRLNCSIGDSQTLLKLSTIEKFQLSFRCKH